MRRLKIAKMNALALFTILGFVSADASFSLSSPSRLSLWWLGKDGAFSKQAETKALLPENDPYDFYTEAQSVANTRTIRKVKKETNKNSYQQRPFISNNKRHIPGQSVQSILKTDSSFGIELRKKQHLVYN